MVDYISLWHWGSPKSANHLMADRASEEPVYFHCCGPGPLILGLLRGLWITTNQISCFSTCPGGLRDPSISSQILLLMSMAVFCFLANSSAESSILSHLTSSAVTKWERIINGEPRNHISERGDQGLFFYSSGTVNLSSSTYPVSNCSEDCENCVLMLFVSIYRQTSESLIVSFYIQNEPAR